MKARKTWVTAAATLALTATACAASAFQGRLADGTASDTCTVTGPGKCAMFYNPMLAITILNDWSFTGKWDIDAGTGSAQLAVETAGTSQTAFSGWSLPTGDPSEGAGPLNQYSSIWNDVGRTSAGLQGQFDGVICAFCTYWSSTRYEETTRAFRFFVGAGAFATDDFRVINGAVAVRPGDVAAAVPEPQTYAMMLLGLGALMVALRRRPA